MDREKAKRLVLIALSAMAVVIGAASALFVLSLYEGDPSKASSLFAFKTILWVFSGASTLSLSVMYLLIRPLLPRTIHQRGDYGSAHWATDKEVKESGLLSAKGIVIGAIKRFGHTVLLRHSGEGHVIVVSPTRSGKGVTVVVPTALTWEHSVLFNDIKGELWTLTAGWRKKYLNSICLRFDATCGDGTAARWNPLFEIRPYPHDVRDAHNIALTLATSDSSTLRTENERHWRVMGARWLKAIILHQLYAGRDKTLPGCYHLLTSVNRDLEDTLLLMLRTKHDPFYQFGWIDPETGKPTPTHPAIAHIARDMLSKSDRERTGIISSAVSYLEPFDDPIMAENVSHSDFSLSDLMNHEQPVSLYLTTPVSDLERVQPLHRLFFTLAGTRNTEHLEFRDGKPAPMYKHPLLEVFDECAHLGYSPVIQKHFSLASGYGIYGLFVFQDLSQLFDLYGRNESITSNCDIKVAFAPNNLETAGYLSKLLGMETRTKESSSAVLFGNNGRGQKQSLGRLLLTPDECARLPRHKSIIVKNGFPPILGDKIPYYEIPALLERSRIPPPASDKVIPKETPWPLKLMSAAAAKPSPKAKEVKPLMLPEPKAQPAAKRGKSKPKPADNECQFDLFPEIKKQSK